MKNLIYVIALLSVVLLSACSNSDQNPISPNTSQFEKSNVLEISQPFSLYQGFPQLKTSTIKWEEEKNGILITVNNIITIRSNRYLFATVENSKGNTTMVFLGRSISGQYHIPGLNASDITAINVFYYDETSIGEVSPPPYSESELFRNLGIKGWSDGGNAVKIKSFPFPTNMGHLFAHLTSSEGMQLIFLGIPRSEDFDFPKSEKLNLKDIKLFAYIK